MLNILAYVRFYLPHSNCGSDRYLHEVLKFFVNRGHQVTVMLGPDAKGCPYEYDGIKVVRREMYGMPYTANADVVFTQLDFTAECLNLIRTKPVVWFSHNAATYSSVARNRDRVTVVYNCEAAKQAFSYPNRSLTLYPPVDYRYYDVSSANRSTWNVKDGYITLINLNENKGQDMFYKLAEMLPEYKFLGVKGSYGTQWAKPGGNVEIIENTADIRQVYSKTSILIMPSEHESWGRTATEAACNGIPVLCTDLPGLRENMGEAGIYLHRLRVKEWADMIRKLTNKKEYAKQSAAVRKRAVELDPIPKLEQFEDELYRIARKQPTHTKKQEYATA